MEMPRPTEQHRRLEKLTGKWIGEEKMNPAPWDPKGGPANGVSESRMDLDGHSRYTYRFLSDDRYELTIEMSQDGES